MIYLAIHTVYICIYHMLYTNPKYVSSFLCRLTLFDPSIVLKLRSIETTQNARPSRSDREPTTANWLVLVCSRFELNSIDISFVNEVTVTVVPSLYIIIPSTYISHMPRTSVNLLSIELV